jgi:hypothetical protein
VNALASITGERPQSETQRVIFQAYLTSKTAGRSVESIVAGGLNVVDDDVRHRSCCGKPYRIEDVHIGELRVEMFVFVTRDV